MIEEKDVGGRPSFVHSYAKQYLEERNIKIYAENKQILEPIKRTIYKTWKLKTGYYVGESFGDNRKIQLINDYTRLKSLGYCIISRPVTDKTRYGQRTQYYLTWNQGTADIRSMPKEHAVQWDAYNKAARLIGPNAGRFSPWISPPGRRPGGTGRTTLRVDDYCRQPEAIARKITREWSLEPEEPVFIPIKEIPFMISDAGEIVCLPRSSDSHTIAICGARGSGKTFLLLRFISCMFWKWDVKFVILNDHQSECGTWCAPNDNWEQYLKLKSINEIPLPLPCVYLHPHLTDSYGMLNGKEVGYEITLPYNEIVTNFKKYMTLNKSSPYFARLRKELLECETIDDVDSLLKAKSDKTITPKEDLVDPNAVKKIKTYMANIFDDELTEKNTGIPHEWKVVEANGDSYRYNPVTACAMAGLIPVFETETLSSKDFFQPYLKYFIEDIFNRQIRDDLFKERNTEVYFFIDELHTLSSTQQQGIVDEILKRVVREGRPRRLGTIIADQEFTKLVHDIKANMKYVITFSNPGEAADLDKTYKLGKHWREEIVKLDTFECLAWATTDEAFIVYTRDGEMYKTRGPIKGRSLPPLSLHKKPKKSNNAGG
jgi:hypothetical protein